MFTMTSKSDKKALKEFEDLEMV